MDADEREIYYYLKSQPREYIPAREICRRVGGKRRMHVSPDWARPVLLRMAERGILECDEKEGYRLKPMPKQEIKGKRWASPAIAKLLKKSGKEFDNVVTPEAEDDYYDNL
jgi:Mn-dependent DtxR family transcriptional regulator